MRRSRNAGFTLLEAVIAMVVVGLAAVSALTAVAAHLRSAERARRALEVTVLAEYRLAALRLVPTEDLGMLPDSVAAGTFAAPFAAYRWTSSVRRVPGERDLYTVTVQVRWADGEYALGSQVYRPPPPDARGLPIGAR